MSGKTDQAGEILGPLTTAWSIPASCSFHFSCSTCTAAYQAQKCEAFEDTRDDTECWPPIASDVRRPQQPLVNWGFYSPGLVCPTGYTEACTAEYGKVPGWELQFKLRPGETAVGCCPEGYSCTNQNGNTCIVIPSESTEVATAQCTGDRVVDEGFRRLPEVVTNTLRVVDDKTITAAPTTSTRVITLMAPLFQLNFQSSDLVARESAASEARQTNSAEPTDRASEEQPSASGLSIGAKAGIGVGFGIGAVLLIGVAWLFYRKRNQRRTAQMSPDESESKSRVNHDKEHPPRTYELPQPPSEMEAAVAIQPVELSASK